MNKTILKTIMIITVSIIFIYAFSVSFSSHSIDNISYVIALGVDLSEDKNNLQVTFEFMDTSSFADNGTSQESPPIIDTVTSTSINSAINLLNSYVGKEINLSHCKVVVFSDELAKKGIFSEITELMNNIQVRPTTNLIISKSRAIEYIQNSTSSLEKVLSKYYDIFPNTSEYTGYTSNIMIGNLYNRLIDNSCGNLAILGGLNEKYTSVKQNSSSSSSSGKSSSGERSSKDESSGNYSNEQSSSESDNQTPSNNISPNTIVASNSPIIGERGTENIGLAVFKEDKYIGDLTAMDTLCHTIITGEVDTFLISIDNPEIYENYIDVNLFENASPEISVDTSGEQPTINIKIKLTGRIVGIKDGFNIVNEMDLDLNKISEAVNKYLKNSISIYLNKTTSEFCCDIDDFYKIAKKNFLTTQEFEDFDWCSKYPNSKFNISIDANVSYSLLNSD